MMLDTLCLKSEMRPSKKWHVSTRNSETYHSCADPLHFFSRNKCLISRVQFFKIKHEIYENLCFSLNLFTNVQILLYHVYAFIAGYRSGPRFLAELTCMCT